MQSGRSRVLNTYDERQRNTALESDGSVLSVTDPSLSKPKWKSARPVRHFQIQNGDWPDRNGKRNFHTAIAHSKMESGRTEVAKEISIRRLDVTKWPWKIDYGSCTSVTAAENRLWQFHIQTSRQTPKIAGAQVQHGRRRVESAVGIG